MRLNSRSRSLIIKDLERQTRQEFAFRNGSANFDEPRSI
jgi:hypothetical protein